MRRIAMSIAVLVFMSVIGLISAQNDGNDQAYIISTPDPSQEYEVIEPPTPDQTKAYVPEIYSFQVHSEVMHRYSRTWITSRVANKDQQKAQEVTFSVVLPETAFISKFIMEIEGKAYEAYVKEKEEAKRDYVHAQSQGQSAGLVEKSTRNSNVFNVNVNIKSGTKVTFNLTYEELLSRRLGIYEQAIIVNPDQVAKIEDYRITVNIEEARNLTFVRVPNLENDVDKPEVGGENKNVIIERPAPNQAKISWNPTTAEQKKISSGKFIVQYDVERDTDAGQILIMEGYFVHFFTPIDLPPLRKHVVFILDISGSMYGRKMDQLKESQKKILKDLSPDDFFNIITFSTEVYLWSPNDPDQNKLNEGIHTNFFRRSSSHKRPNLETTPPEWFAKRQSLPANPENVKKANRFIDSLIAQGSTNIHDAIIEALNLTAINKKAQQMSDQEKEGHPISAIKVILPHNVQSLIIFLTDGEPTVGITNPPEIQKLIQAANRNLSIPIFSLGFGQDVDFPFLKKLSLQNHGFGRKIYEASDASLQLQGFYKEIASPLLANVTFNYTSADYNVTDVTVTKFPTVFGGTEIAVSGRIEGLPEAPIAEEEHQNDEKRIIRHGCIFRPMNRPYFDVTIHGNGRHGGVGLQKVNMFERYGRCLPWPWSPHPIPHPPPKSPPQSAEDLFLERLWAYLTIQQLIEEDLAEGAEKNDKSDNENVSSNSDKQKPNTAKGRALQLALKYGFVTPLTSLVVVKPNSSDVTNAESADGPQAEFRSLAGGGGPMPMALAFRAAMPMASLMSSQPMMDYSASNNAYAIGGNRMAVRKSKPVMKMHKANTRLASVSYDDDYDPPSTTTTSFTLKNISWLKEDETLIRVNNTAYTIATNKTTSEDNSGYECRIKPKNGTDPNTINASGTCLHLRLCVRSDFVNCRKAFIKSYFCRIVSTFGSDQFVGSCCPS